MAAVLQLEPTPTSPRSSRPRHPAGHHRPPRPRPARCTVGAIHRRRRFLAALAGLVLLLTVARAGAALAGSSLNARERTPHVTSVVVQEGDSLWSLAPRLAPKTDTREVVDALVEARGTSVVIPGETLTWLDE